MSSTSYDIQLQPETLAAFDKYVLHAETQMAEQRRANTSLLWSDADPDRARKIRKGATIVQMWSGDKPLAIPHGLIHDWVGALFVPGATIQTSLAVLQDYDNHFNIYSPDVISSKLISRDQNHFQIYLRLLKKKVITVVLDTDHDVRYASVRPDCWVCDSRTTRIAEVENAGSAKEKTLPADIGHGFLWRLYSYWLLQQSDSGTVIECRPISLTRDIPMALKLIVQPIVRNLPRESLVATLEATKRALLTRQSHQASAE